MMIVWLDSDLGGNEELRYLVSERTCRFECTLLEKSARKTERVTRFLLLAFKFG